MTMLLQIHPKNPEERKVRQVCDALRHGAVVIYPTDTVYGMGCDIEHPEAIERICTIKQVNPAKVQLSFLCHDLSHLSEYTKSISTPLYRFLKQHVPGAYTFILPASKKVPKLLRTKRDTVGIRVPNNLLSQAILKELGRPILSTSLPAMEHDFIYTDPMEIHEEFQNLVDIVIDGGLGGSTPSTIVDCIASPPVVIREGAGILEYM